MSKSSIGTRDMTVGKPASVMISFALPIMLSQLFQQMYNIADSLIVGQYLGTNSLAAVSSSGTLIFLLVSFFNGTASGAGVAISRYFGAGDKDNVSRAIHTNIAFGLASGLTLTIIGVVFTPTFLTWMRTDPEVLPEAIEYFRFYFLGALALIMYNICTSILNAVGDSKRPLRYLIISSMMNVVLDILFVGVFKFGVWSAAVATVLSQLTSVILCLIYLCKKGNVFSVDFKKVRFHKDMFLEIVRYGLPSGIQNSVIGIANVLVQTQINSFGKFATAAYGSHAKIEGFVFLPIGSFSMAISTFISQNLGAKQYSRAKQGAKFGIIVSVSLAAIIGILCYIFSPVLIGLFDDSSKVIHYGVTQERIVSLFYSLLALSHAIASVCRGSGKAFVPMFVMLLSWCAIRIVYIEIMMHTFGDIRLVYWAYPITWFISSVIYLIYYFKSDWIHGFDARPIGGKRFETPADNDTSVDYINDNTQNAQTDIINENSEDTANASID